MLQGTFALFNRALSVDFRLMRTHLFRFLFALLILLCLVSAHMSSRFMGAAGLTLFTQIIYLNFVFILMAAFSFFATAITEEKEEQTIGLLLMAGVNPVSLLLGKTLPRLISALLLLSVQFPFTLLAITLGGVTLSQVIAAYAALAAFLFWMANLGLFCSVVCARSRTASTLVVIALALFFLGTPILDLILNASIQEGWISKELFPVIWANSILDGLASASIISQVNSILTTGFSDSAWGFQFWSNLVFGIILFVFANLLFNRFALTDNSAGPGRSLITKKKAHFLSPGRSWQYALIWKDFFFVNGGYTMALVKFMAYGIALFSLCSFIGYTSRRYSIEEIGMTLFWTMLIVLLIEISLISARVFHVERQWNTLVSTAMLPHSMAYIAYTKILGCLLGTLPAFFYMMLGVFLSLNEMRYDSGLVLAEPGFWMTCVEILFFWHLTAYLSTYIKWGALPLAFVLMWVGNMFFFFSISLLALGSTMPDMDGIVVGFTFMMVLGIIVSHFLIKERLVYLASQ